VILAVDPGTTESAFVLYAPDVRELREMGKWRNERLLTYLRIHSHGLLVVERMAGYGMAVGAEVLETCWWAGRFAEARGGVAERVFRREVKRHLLGKVTGNDAQVRAALIRLFGGPAATKRGGPLHGVVGDIWAALGVAVTYAASAAEERAA